MGILKDEYTNAKKIRLTNSRIQEYRQSYNKRFCLRFETDNRLPNPLSYLAFKKRIFFL